MSAIRTECPKCAREIEIELDDAVGLETTVARGLREHGAVLIHGVKTATSDENLILQFGYGPNAIFHTSQDAYLLIGRRIDRALAQSRVPYPLP